MCQLLTTFHCAHYILDTRHRCLEYQRLYKLAKRQQSHGLLSCFFPSPRIRVRCNAAPDKRIVLDLCPGCKVAKGRSDQEFIQKRATAVRESQKWEAIRNEQVAKAMRERERASYRCRLCISEGRRPDARNRAANSGLCCARGLAEYADQNRTRIPRPPTGSSRRPVERERITYERIPQPQTGISRIPKQRERAREKPLSQPQAGPSRKPAEMVQMKKKPLPQLPAPPSRKPIQREQTWERRPELRRVKSREKLRSDATKAADSYGWDRQQRDSTYLEPSLVKQYINTPGADPRTIGTGPPVPEPHYEEPAIDWNQWWAAKQGPHGRLPPMPEGPLPIRPLKTLREQNVRPLTRKPVPTQKPNGSRDLRVEPVSPLSSPITSDPSPVSPSARTEELLSDLDERLVDAMHGWTPVRIAAPTPVVRKAQWR
ncbi:hypothetical protein BKA64DRAFT_637900 [Cadophora sp. MPI-SDFR-AT-0126]|nr:hypothetical protein BKA64DRAFT_637900 [Leotiomycetes sp. MPI-SDFR-AT-0126]